MNGKKTLVYPYDIELTPVLRHPELLSGYNIAYLVSPPGWGSVGRDASDADGGDKLNINISSDFEGLLPLCDAVIFSESERKPDFKKYVLPKLIASAELGKEIIFLPVLEGEDKNLLEDTCNKYSIKLKSYKDEGSTLYSTESDYFKLYKINTPVIFVAGVHKKTHKFEILLSLRESFINSGDRVSQIGSRNYCEMLGFHSIPQFMYNSCWTETKKIVAFNHYIKEMENLEKPDVIIIGIPGGVMKLNDNFTGQFGITAFEISQAVTPDVAVLSTFYEEFSPEYFQNMFTSIKYKLGFDITCYNFCNIKFDWEVSRDIGEESYLLIDSGFIDKSKTRYDKLKTPVFNILNNEDRTNMANCLIDTLSYFGEVELV
jgi:peptide maturation system protein (TIGR04066 family)